MLADFCDFMQQEYRSIIKYISTRWLSLEAAVTRILKQYESLKSYFLSENEKGNRFERLVEKFQCPMTEVYLLFYQYALQSFIRFNLYLQREDPLVSKLHTQIQRFLKDLACKFIRIMGVHCST